MPKILVVDDDSGVLEPIRLKMAGAGFSVVTAEDGVEALALIASGRPDLVILDVGLPGLSGIEVLNRVKRDLNPQVAATPIIIMTAAPEEAVGRCAGCSYFMSKPFSLREMLGKVREILGLGEVVSSVKVAVA
jgi:DNA-binding response OmpR family regulator